MNCLHLTEPNPTDTLGKVKVCSRQMVTSVVKMMMMVIIIIIIIIIIVSNNKAYRNRVLGCRLDSSGTGHG